MDGHLLQISDLRTEIRSRQRVVRAVDGVSLHVDQGEVLGIVGESGCGKTMTALSVLRLLPHGGQIAGGRIEFGGRDLTRLTERGMRAVRGNEIGMVFQDPLSSLNPTVPIGTQVAEPVLLHRRVSARQARERAVEVLGLVGLPKPAERMNDYPHQLSGGMRQRVMIAIALACEPKLLIADEPTTALDVTIQQQILSLLAWLNEQLGMAMILVTHDLGVIAGHAHRVSVMYAGRVAESAATEPLFAGPRHPYTAALFEALPERAAGRGDPLRTIGGHPPDLSKPLTGCRFAPRCERAQADCRTTEPPQVESEPGHDFACLHPLPAARPPDGETAAGPGPAKASAGTSAVAGAGTSAPTAGPTAGRAGEVLLQLEDVCKEYPVTKGLVLRRRVGAVSAVAGVSLEVKVGETLGIVGESGCGKTTIGRLIVGLEQPTSGHVRVRGQDIAELHGTERKDLHRQIQFMFQDTLAAMDPRMRVASILREPLVVQGIGGGRDQQRAVVGHLLGEVGMPAASVQRYPHEFSGGQRQRLGLARSLILQPGLIVADEPVSALDMSIQAQVLNLMRDLQQAHGLSYVFISHDLSVVRYVADTIAVMYLGKLVETGPAAAVYDRPLHPYTKALIDTLPVADPVRERARRSAGISGEIASAINPPSGCRFRTRCPRARPLCAEQEPPLAQVEESPQRVACHFPLIDEPAEVEESIHAPTD